MVKKKLFIYAKYIKMILECIICLESKNYVTTTSCNHNLCVDCLFRIKDMSFNLFIAYLKFYLNTPVLVFKKILNFFKF